MIDRIRGKYFFYSNIKFPNESVNCLKYSWRHEMNYKIVKVLKELKGLKDFKIVTKIRISFFFIVIISIAAVGYLVKESVSTKGLIQDLFGTFNIANNVLKSEVLMTTADKKLIEIAASIEKKEKQEAILIISQLSGIDTSFKDTFLVSKSICVRK